MNYLEIIEFRERYPHCHLLTVYSETYTLNGFPCVPISWDALHSKKYNYVISEKNDVIIHDIITLNGTLLSAPLAYYQEEMRWKIFKAVIKKYRIYTTLKNIGDNKMTDLWIQFLQHKQQKEEDMIKTITIYSSAKQFDDEVPEVSIHRQEIYQRIKAQKEAA